MIIISSFRAEMIKKPPPLVVVVYSYRNSSSPLFSGTANLFKLFNLFIIKFLFKLLVV